MNSRPDSPESRLLAELFCARCGRLDQRQQGKCPKGQTTCGAQIDASYRLKRPYAGLPTGSIVTIKDIFWAVNADYATVTIANEQKQRFGVACTLLEAHPDAAQGPVYQLPLLDNFHWMSNLPESERPALLERGLDMLVRDLQHGPRRRTLPGHNLLTINEVEKLAIPLTARAVELVQQIKKLTLEDELMTGVRAIMMLMRAGLHEPSS